MIVFFDFDSTVVTKETLDEAIARALAEHPDKERIMRDIEETTKLGMEGKLDFTASVRRRISVVPLSRMNLEETGTDIQTALTPGMEEVFAWLAVHGHTTYIVSGGFEECILPTAEYLHIPRERILTNKFTFAADGNVSGIDESSLLWTNEGKGPALRAMRDKHPGERFVIVGDGMNDYRAYESGAADEFIGFGANVVRESLRTRASTFCLNAKELLAFLQARS